MSRGIPTELCENMIDVLSTDRKALGECGLVCSAWLPRSRFHLFSSIGLLCSTSAPFIHILGSPTCTFASFVRKLTIYFGSEHETNAGMVAQRFLRLATSSAFRRLTEVMSLRLVNIDWTLFSIPQQTAIESSLGRMLHIKKLQLHSVTFHDLRSALRLVDSFPKVNHVCLVGIQFSKYPEYNISSSNILRIPSTLETIETDSVDVIPAFLYCVSRNAAVSPLAIRLIKVMNFAQDEVSYVREALRSFDGSLQHVSLVPSDYVTLTDPNPARPP
ncbi:hypothetical protein B0H10DRAFT_2023510 [Mycena sp. CBHHK59/15]|nr:hypothetical protein B0H10DRAFT_2023510 [Mycena sp. CBHHK59/15]